MIENAPGTPRHLLWRAFLAGFNAAKHWHTEETLRGVFEKWCSTLTARPDAQEGTHDATEGLRSVATTNREK